MKTIGMVGGIGPESTIDYYRAMIAAYRERQPDGSYPSIVINSIDLTKLVGMIVKGVLLDETRNELVRIAARLNERSGIEALILGGTELPLILRDPTAAGLPLLDTTQIHARAIVAQAFS